MGYHFDDRATFWLSLGVTFLGAALFSWSRNSRDHQVPQEAIIGITFVVAAADVDADVDAAIAMGMRVRLWDFLFCAAFAVVAVSFVRVAGVLLTFAYLIVPAVCAVMIARTWLSRLITGCVIAALSSLAGLWASYRMDLPTGAAIVAACGLALIMTNVFVAVRRKAA